MPHGRVLNPRFLASLLQWALEQWRLNVRHSEIDFGDGLPALLDFRFADDLFLFAINRENLVVM